MGVLGAAFALVLGGGAFAAYQYLSGGGPQPSESVPANTLAYARVDLDPSASQKVNAFRLMRQIPDFESATGITSDTEDLRQLMFDTMVGEMGCDLSYESDVAPWIGDRAGLAAVPVNDDVATVATVQVSDQAAAEEAVSAFEECGVPAPELGTGDMGFGTDVVSAAAGGPGATGATTVAANSDRVGFVGDYMLISDSPDNIDDIVAAAKEGALSEDGRFQADMEALDGEGIASFWFDVKGLQDEIGALDEMSEEERAMYDRVGSVFGALRAGSDHIELVVQSDNEAKVATPDDNPVGSLPDSTVLAVSASGGSELVGNYWEDLRAMLGTMEPEAYEESVEEFEDTTGLVLPDDLQTLLGDNLTLAVDREGLSEAAFESGDLSQLNIGARLTTDPAASQDALDRINAELADEGYDSLPTQEVDDGLVVATNTDYAERLASGGDLGSQGAFETAVPDASSAGLVFYLDFDQLTSAMEADGEDVEQIEPIRSFGASVAQVEDGQRTTMRLVFD